MTEPQQTNAHIPCPSDVALLPHQRLAVDFAKTHPACGLFLEIGCGKTRTTLQTLYELDEPGHVLIIGPKPVMRSTWSDEIEKFGYPFRTRSLIVDGNGKTLSKKKRDELVASIPDEPASIWFINRELLAPLVDNMPRDDRGRIMWPFSTVVVDEAQSFKSRKSKRFKALATVRPATRRFIELSGMPAPNNTEELWALVYLLDGGKRLGKNITRFRETWFTPGHVVNPVTHYPVTWDPRPGAIDDIYNRISDVAMSMRNVSGLMPAVTVNDIPVYISDEERKIYEKLATNAVLMFKEGDGASAANAAVLSAKLMQLASGTLYTEEIDVQEDRQPRTHGAADTAPQRYLREVHERKLDALATICAQASSPILVAYYFRCDKDRIVDGLKSRGFDAVAFDGSPQMLREWNAQQIPVMLLHPASAGQGLNLQAGGHTLVWYTLTWSLDNYTQTNGRIARQGQKHPVIIHRLLTDDTVDFDIAAALEDKDVSHQRLMSAIRRTATAVGEPI